MILQCLLLEWLKWTCTGKGFWLVLLLWQSEYRRKQYDKASVFMWSFYMRGCCLCQSFWSSKCASTVKLVCSFQVTKVLKYKSNLSCDQNLVSKRPEKYTFRRDLHASHPTWQQATTKYRSLFNANLKISIFVFSNQFRSNIKHQMTSNDRVFLLSAEYTYKNIWIWKTGWMPWWTAQVNTTSDIQRVN